MYEQVDFLPDEERESVLHVFGHTFATPRIFYYRQLVTVNPNYRYWTAWEKVPLDIEADEVLPVIWNRRLYLFWQVFTEKAEQAAGKIKRSTVIIRLAWSEYRHGKWSRKAGDGSRSGVRIAVRSCLASIQPRMNVEVQRRRIRRIDIRNSDVELTR